MKKVVSMQNPCYFADNIGLTIISDLGLFQQIVFFSKIEGSIIL